MSRVRTQAGGLISRDCLYCFLAGGAGALPASLLSGSRARLVGFLGAGKAGMSLSMRRGLRIRLPCSGCMGAVMSMWSSLRVLRPWGGGLLMGLVVSGMAVFWGDCPIVRMMFEVD